MMTFRLQIIILLLTSVLGLFGGASPTIRSSDDVLTLYRRTDPYFPDTPASCPICAQISYLCCAAAAPVLANFTNIIFNPGAFIDVIKCACTGTFQSAYPQCVDCFIKTNQEQVLDYNTEDLPGILDGMRRICALQSSLLGNVSEANGEVTPVAPPPPKPTSAASSHAVWGGVITLMILALSVGGLHLGV
ncbi:hypothetical protein D9615_007944 [Tricholomella constricta]|uniref:Uncharacterized protein n=1 Tax=Tricholomella constricta TaxID=117010 RepID=A0A8H5H290_9AGAR|nr:hypothetical protein D9615_007944 [Tricholomella constricta]